ncbi:MAG: hypothetical protein J5863_02555 [Desulfovibrio sp.]|nr:hypothetical protein [Desulfovibrio sp.]MBR4746659.1 hypothetical protein [Desulfovibrio sp.]
MLRSGFEDGASSVTVPAGTLLAISGAPDREDGGGDRICVWLCEDLGGGLSRELGFLPVDELEADCVW